MRTLVRYFHTIRYLRPIQIAGRIGLRLYRPRPDLRAAPPVRSAAALYVEPIPPAPSMVAADVFRFLNVERRCAGANDWNPADAPKLWNYNLHYFDDLNALNAQARRAWHENLIERWVRQNPPGARDGWEPYPVSRRIVNWIKWAARGNVLSAVARDSLATQARWLARRLEYHILGNHLLANAKALIYAGLFFEGVDAERWFSRGIDLLKNEMREQILADGGHFELSTMYHAGVLEDLLDLANLLRAYERQSPEGLVTAITRMRRWLMVMTHPDGDISFFNDAAFGITPRVCEIEAYAARLDLPIARDCGDSIVRLHESGYTRVRIDPAFLICDCAAIGPDYLPGHAHADTLSFELSLFGQRVFVNSGTSLYGSGPERQRQRGTAAHNTVVVDEQDSSEVWDGFRVARRARVQSRVATAALSIVVEGSHDGYRRLAGKNVHRRRWILSEDSLCIEDEISGNFRCAEAYFHLHPRVDAQMRGPREVLLTGLGSGSARMDFEGAAGIDIRNGAWRPQFGIKVANKCVIVRFSGSALATRVSWAPQR